MTTTSASRAGFHSLAPELRLMIYRLVLRRARVIGTWSLNKEQWPDHPIRLSSQLLRTCKQIHAEGLPILYGENTVEIEISNTYGPYSRCLHCPKFLEGYLGLPSPRNSIRYWRAVVPHLRRLSIRVRYTEHHKLTLIRDVVRQLVWRLQKAPLPRIEFLRLNCELYCKNEDTGINWRDPCWDNYRADGDRQECIGVLRTWLGRLRNVKEVAIEGLETEDAEILRERLQTTSEGEDSSQAPSLSDMYEELERCAGDIDFCKEDLGWALLATEDDDVEEFRECRDDVFESLKGRWKTINSKERLWQF